MARFSIEIQIQCIYTHVHFIGRRIEEKEKKAHNIESNTHIMNMSMFHKWNLGDDNLYNTDIS